MKILLLPALLLTLSMSTVCLAGEAGSALKADDIRTEPFSDAKKAGSLTAGTAVVIEKRQGGWLLLSSPKKGWVRMLSVRRGGAAGVKASGVVALASGRAGTGNVVSSTGVRGLNEEQLKNARFDEKELKLAESYSANKKDAGKFADKAKLKARKLDYLP